jgi:hypothetical protein
MQVMCDITDPVEREHTMTKRLGKAEVIDLKALLAADADFLRATVRAAIEAALEAEMTEALGAEKGERTESRLGYRSGYYQRSLITRVGTLELRVPQDRAGRFSTESFEPPGAEGGDPRSAVGGGVAALLRALPAQRAGLCAAQGG